MQWWPHSSHGGRLPKLVYSQSCRNCGESGCQPQGFGGLQISVEGRTEGRINNSVLLCSLVIMFRYTCFYYVCTEMAKQSVCINKSLGMTTLASSWHLRAAQEYFLGSHPSAKFHEQPHLSQLCQPLCVQSISHVLVTVCCIVAESKYTLRKEDTFMHFTLLWHFAVRFICI